MSSDYQSNNFLYRSCMAILTVFLCSMALPTLAQESSLSKREQMIAERIKPLAEVHVAGEEQVSTSASADNGAAKTPQAIFQSTCAACHTTGVSGAPIVGKKADWEPRIATGMDKLYDAALHGLNAMPARGLCMQCSDDELKAVVDYMVEQVK